VASQSVIRKDDRTGMLAAARFRELVFRAVMYVIIVSLGAVFIMPLAWLISTSLKVSGQEFTYPPQWIPRPFAWDNYVKVFQIPGLPFGRFMLNTIFIVVVNMIGGITSATLVAYSFARLRYPGRDFFFGLCISTMMLPGIVTLIPTYILWSRLKFVDSFVPLTVPSFFGGGAFFIFLTRQFFMGLPYELEEAARIDGASSFRIWWQVMLPLSGPVLAAMAIFSFQSHWNAFLGPLIYLNTNTKFTMAIGLRAMQGMYGGEWNQIMAASTIMVVPVVILFFSAQRYFMRGIALTGLAGR